MWQLDGSSPQGSNPIHEGSAFMTSSPPKDPTSRCHHSGGFQHELEGTRDIKAMPMSDGWAAAMPLKEWSGHQQHQHPWKQIEMQNPNQP